MSIENKQTIDVTLLLEHVTQFRAAFESVLKSNEHPYFKNFPTATCGNTSYLLKEYLDRLGYPNVVVITGSVEELEELESYRSHAWIEVGGFLADITADQFGEPPVIVTQSSMFHRQFTCRKIKKYGLRDLKPNEDLMWLFEKTLAEMTVN